MFDIPCIIFAGGKSSRMGEDKSLLPFSTSPTLTQYQLTKLTKIFTNVYISCKNKDKFDFEANYIEDISETTYAPTAGFLSVYNTLDTDRFFVLSVDSPLITYKEIKKLLESDRDTYDATVAKTDSGIQPMCGIYHRSMQTKFAEMHMTNKHKLGYLLKSSNTKYLHFEDETPFTNINHPHEYQKALTLI